MQNLESRTEQRNMPDSTHMFLGNDIGKRQRMLDIESDPQGPNLDDWIDDQFLEDLFSQHSPKHDCSKENSSSKRQCVSSEVNLVGKLLHSDEKTCTEKVTSEQQGAQITNENL